LLLSVCKHKNSVLKNSSPKSALCKSFLNIGFLDIMGNLTVRGLIIAMTALIIAQKECLAQDGKPAPVRIGTAPTSEIGALPPLTSAIGKRAAKAFLQGKWHEARDAYLEILRSDPDNAPTLTNLGATFLELEQYTQARKHLEKALQVNPGLHQARIILGVTYLRSGDSYRAIAALSRVVAEQPKNARAHNYLAVATLQRGWTTAAERQLQEAVSADPGFAEAHYNLAIRYMEKTPPAVELAHRHYQRAIDLGATPSSRLSSRINSTRNNQ
jgi:tetratricopeptide (TPR) repeat protein